MITANVKDQKTEIGIGFKTLCFECFLSEFNFYNKYEHKIDYSQVMEII
jgi:hypothetical protein